MTARKILLDQLAACNDKNAWFVSMKSALAGLTAGQAAQLPSSGGHSIWQILNHVHFWTERYLARFRALPLAEVKDNSSTFFPPASAAEAAWQEACTRFSALMAEWEKSLAEAPEAKLEGPIRPDAPDTWYFAIANMLLHAAHHIGQIVTLRKVQGSWDPHQGVS